MLFAGLLHGGCGDDDSSATCPHIASWSEEVQVDEVEAVDLLFMMDNSSSMAEERARLAAEIPRLVQVLASGVNRDETFPPVPSLRVGVISSDMGSGPNGACSSEFGDDGVLATAGDTSTPGCDATYPSWLQFAADTDDAVDLASDVACVTDALGSDGCEFEQHLEAILKALTPASSSITFPGGSSAGHGDGENAGFLRPNSLLAIVALSDEDDCSVTDPGLFDPDDPTYDSNVDLRCFLYPEALQPIGRFVDGLLALREADPGRLLFSVIAGVPRDLVPSAEMPLAPQIAAILADPRMIQVVDPEDSSQLAPACEVPGVGDAVPARRMLELAAELDLAGANATVQSICEESFTGALNPIIAKLTEEPGTACLPFTLNHDSSGKVDCEVVEVIDPSIVGSCAEVPGRLDDGVDEELGRPRCKVNQVVVPGGSAPPAEPAGWYYDDFSADVLEHCEDTPQRLSFTRGAEPRQGSVLRLDCTYSLLGQSDVVEVGTSCARDPRVCESASAGVLERFPRGLVCESTFTVTCQPACTSVSDCPPEYDCVDVGGIGSMYCVDPRCPVGESP